MSPSIYRRYAVDASSITKKPMPVMSCAVCANPEIQLVNQKSPASLESRVVTCVYSFYNVIYFQCLGNIVAIMATVSIVPFPRNPSLAVIHITMLETESRKEEV